MAQILVYTSPARGHLYPCTPIMDELRRRGHEICLRTLASEVETMRSRGFDTEPISPEIERIELQDWRGGNPRAGLKLAVGCFSARAEHDAADLQRAIEQHQPDAVLIDVNSWGAQAMAERWGGPWATFCPYPLALRAPGIPPFGPGLAPATGVLGRVRDRVMGRLVGATVTGAMLPPLNRVRAAAEIDPLATVDALFTRPPLTIYLTAEPFEYHRDWPDSVVLVGPCAWEPAAAVPDWLAEAGTPVVLVTTSSEFQDDGRLVRTALQALADEPVQVIVTMPAGVPDGLAVPANARVLRYLAHSTVLPRASCAITHGGMGATQKALAHGVPVCAVPFGRDQLEVARRVEVAGAGVRLPAGRLNPDRLRAAVRRASTLRDGAQRVAAGFAAAGGAVAAASAIENRLLGKLSPSVAN